jgi:hypothetical protein
VNAIRAVGAFDVSSKLLVASKPELMSRLGTVWTESPMRSAAAIASIPSRRSRPPIALSGPATTPIWVCPASAPGALCTSTVAAAFRQVFVAGRAALEAARSNTDRAPKPKSSEERDLARRFADAYVAGDLESVLRLLTDDSWLSMPPAPHQYHGLDAIRSFFVASFAFRGQRGVYLISCRTNKQPAFGSYLADQVLPIARPAGLFVLTLANERITTITRFHRDDLYSRLGLPASLHVAARK